jgi:photosystem II stability/assembly factor-like uncharacterized protein
VAVLGAVFAGQAVAAHVVPRMTGDGATISDLLPHSVPGLMADFKVVRREVARGEPNWQQLTVPGGVYLRAISMASAQVGFAAGELGKVLRTTDGGDTWQYVLNQGFPYYYYGCQAIDEQTVIVSGFQNQSGEGIIRWSEDGGQTWGPVVALPGPGGVKWLAHVEFIDPDRGIVEAAWAGGIHRTTNGGRTADDWTYVEPSGSWFLGTFTYLPDGRVWLAGIDIVNSPDHGVSWSQLPSTSAIFDGPIAILESNQGFVGGGTISPAVAGWVYETSDGGSSWSPSPVLTTPYPVRGLMLLDEDRAWAVGGNVFTNVGGIWGTTDGGETWALEQNTANETIDLDWVRVDSDFVDVYAAGYVSQIWRARVFAPTGAPCPWDLDDSGSVGITDLLVLLAAWGPNPGHPADFNGDDFVGINDLLALLANWGACPE